MTQNRCNHLLLFLYQTRAGHHSSFYFFVRFLLVLLLDYLTVYINYNVPKNLDQFQSIVNLHTENINTGLCSTPYKSKSQSQQSQHTGIIQKRLM